MAVIKNMRSRNTLALLLLLFTFGWLNSAWAINLQTIKDQGWVGETPSGYLAMVRGGAPKEVQKLMASINAQRKTLYKKISQRNKTSLQTVEALAGKKAIGKSEAGHNVMINGEWVKKQ